MHRMYENEDIVVFWDSEKCFHAMQCVHGSPSTFKPGSKPWINLNNAKTQEIWQTISKCPSGALTCMYRNNVDVTLDLENNRSIAVLDGKQIGECCYQQTDSGWNICHTVVSPDYQGKGIAKRLVYKVLEEAERNNIKVESTCSYADKLLDK